MFTYNSIYIKSINEIAKEIMIDGGNILITGATGLIGSCLVDVLLEANRSLNKRFTIYAMGRDEERLRKRFNNTTEIKYIVHNVVNPIEICGIDYIVHAASNADPQKYALYPVETILTNTLGAQNVLDLCLKDAAKAVLTSSFEVYGKGDKDEYRESDYGFIDLDLLRSCYPESKRTAEMLFKSYFDEYNVSCNIARLASIYGPTMLQGDSKAHAQFLKNALAGNNIVLKSQGLQKRTYCYVMDAVSGLLTILFKGKNGEAYNVANKDSVATIAEVAQTIAEITGKKVIYDLPDEIEKKGFSKPQNCVLNTDKIYSLGWSGKYSLRKGLSETISILAD